MGCSFFSVWQICTINIKNDPAFFAIFIRAGDFMLYRISLGC